MNDKIVSSLHRLERTLLPALTNQKQSISVLEQKTKLSATEIRRAIQWLEQKKLIVTKEQKQQILYLEKNGKHYLKKGLPEHTLLSTMSEKKIDTIKKLLQQETLTAQEVSAGIGILRQQQYIIFEQNKIKLTAAGQKALQQPWMEEQLLIKLKTPLSIEAFNEEEKKLIQKLIKRKDIIKSKEEKKIEVALSVTGEKLDLKQAHNLTDELTSQMLRDGSWKNKEFRRFTLNSMTPKTFGGRKQPYRLFLDEVRKKFVSLGFKELSGPLVETEFWNMDALFMPQFHSARDIHDAYYIKEPSHSTSLPKDIVKRVKQAHEKGVTGSRGWRYTFDEKRTHRYLLRTQDTAITPRALASPELSIPGKYFQMVRCFRHDVIDATHLADFSQTGGFVVEEEVNLRHLLDY